MANNKIQIKRSITTAITNTTPTVSNGELIFTSNGYILAIGDPANSANVISIGGARYPGVLTANQALVANATSGIDKIITANLTLSGASVSAINAVANLTTLGTPSNSELTTTWAIKTFVDAKIAQASNPQGTNGQFQYNNSGVLAGTNNMVFDNTTGQITVGNSSVNVQIGYTGSINALAHFHGQQNGYVQVILQNSNGGNRASSDFVLENDVGTETVNFLDLGINSSTYDDPSFSAMGAGDSYLYASNNDLVIGTASANDIRFITGGTTTSEIRVEIDAGGNVGIGNTAPNARLQVTGTANISGLTTLSGNLVLSTTSAIVANGTVGTAGQVLFSNATSVYWATPATGVSGSDTQIQYNDGGNLAGAAGLTFAKASNNVTIANSLFVTGTVNSASHTSGAIGTGTGGTVQNTTTMFLGNNTINTVITSAGLTVNGTATIANSSGVYTTGVVNSASHTSGAIGTGTGGTVQNATVMFVGNNTINAVINSTALSIGGNLIANSTGSNNAFNLGGTAAASYQLNSTLAGNVALLTANNANNLGGVLAANYVQNTDSRTLSGNLTFSGASVTFTGANLTVTGTNTAFTSNVTIGGTNAAISANLTLTGASLTGTSTDLTMRNGTFSGNLIVQGAVVTVNTAQISVNDNIIQLAYNQTTTDTVDTGFFAPAGNSTAIWYSGIARIAASSTNAAPVFRVFASNTNPNTAATIDTSANTRTGFIQAFLAPYGIGGALIANSTNVTITANSTLAVSITANSLSLSTPLSGNNGGTGLSSIANNSLIFGNSTNGFNALALGSSGFVLQSNGTAVVYDTLDGGTF
jgi:hypothetical protein